MASITQPVNITTYKAGGTIRAYRFIKIDDSNGTVSECDANGRALGIGQNESSVSTGELLEVALSGGGAKLEISETIGEGKMLTSTATGTGEIVDSAGEWSGAVAFTGGVSGDIISVRVTGFQAVATDA